MAKKLTIEVEDHLADQIEQIARRRHQSISELTASLYQTLLVTEIDEKLAPITARYKGVLPNTEIEDRSAATNYLAHRHG